MSKDAIKPNQPTNTAVVSGSDSINQVRSKAFENAPNMSSQSLTAMLIAMCLVPPITIFTLWNSLPPVYEGQLDATVAGQNLPADQFYEAHYADRPKYSDGQLVVRNNSDQDWTHLNIMVNHYYQIHDSEPILAGQERVFELNRFISRTGARFDLTYNPLRNVRIYARRPTRDRATFYHDFEKPPE